MFVVDSDLVMIPLVLYEIYILLYGVMCRVMYQTKLIMAAGLQEKTKSALLLIEIYCRAHVALDIYSLIKF